MTWPACPSWFFVARANFIDQKASGSSGVERERDKDMLLDDLTSFLLHLLQAGRFRSKS